MNVEQRQAAADPQTKPPDLGRESAKPLISPVTPAHATDLFGDGPRRLRQTCHHVVGETSVRNVVLQQKNFVLRIFVADVAEHPHVVTLCQKELRKLYTPTAVIF